MKENIERARGQLVAREPRELPMKILVLEKNTDCSLGSCSFFALVFMGEQQQLNFFNVRLLKSKKTAVDY